MLNVVAILGRLVADPELRHTSTGVSVTTFTLAVDRRYTPQGQERQADFIDVVAWRNTAEFVCRYFTKGRLMAVSGSIQTRNYEDRNGNKRKAVEIVADNVSFAGDSRRDSSGAGTAPTFGGEDAPVRPAEPQQQARPSYTEPAPAFTNGNEEDFEEILGNDLLPF